MYIVLGASGHIGAQVVRELKTTGHSVIALAHSAEKARDMSDGNLIEGVPIDVGDAEALREVFKRSKRAFLLNPPASPKSDTNAEELRTARSIAKAVDGSGLEKVVVASTYGAQEGNAIGDLSVLWEFERLVEATGVPTAVNRGAYYLTNLDQLLEPAKQGVLPTPFPADLVLPMVSPIDLGAAAAARLKSSIDDVGIKSVEGPRRYTFADVASAFSELLRHDVSLELIPRDRIESNYRQLGFSEPAARAFTRMTIATLDGPDHPADP